VAGDHTISLTSKIGAIGGALLFIIVYAGYDYLTLNDPDFAGSFKPIYILLLAIFGITSAICFAIWINGKMS
jgi:uncharacterized membrane protein YozB (DUF420 family)